MTKAITGIDHTLIGVADLEAARGTYSRLGFAVTPRGSHIGWGTANYCIMFEHDYAELIGIVDPEQFTNNLDTFLETGEGLMAVAFASDDIEATKARLDERGIANEGPRDLKRNLELPEGTVQPEFKLLFPDPVALPGMPGFVCHHLTPDMIRKPEWLVHPNGATGLASVTALVEDPPALADTYATLFGAGEVNTTDDVLTVHVGPHRLHFVKPDELPDLHPASEMREPHPLPMLAVMSVRTVDQDAAAAHLRSNGIDFHAEADGTLSVAPENACGLWLEFVAD